MNRRQKIIVSVVGIFIVLLALVGLTYAYFLTRVIGNGETKSISVTTASLQLVYDNGSSSLIQNDTLISPNSDEPVGTKTFTVTNNGNGRVDNYGVFLEEFAIKYANDTIIDGVEISAGTPTSFASPNDMKLDIVCKAYRTSEYNANKETATASECSGMDVLYTTLPTSNDMLLSNGIDVGVTHEYTVTLTYLETGLDQSDDMNKTIEGLIQIYGLNDVVDIEGEITGANTGDYAQLNSEPKKSQIINGKYKFAGVTPGNHTFSIFTKDGVLRGSKPITIKMGKVANTDNGIITINEESKSVSINIPSISTTLGLNIGNITQTEAKPTTPFAAGTLAEAIYKNAKSENSGTTFSENPLTIPGQKISLTEGSGEYGLQEIEDSLMPYGFDPWLVADTEAGASNGKTVSSCAEILEAGKYVIDQSSYISGVFYVESCSATGKPIVNTEIIKYEKVLSVTTDDDGPSYYFRGNVDDNYVNFAGMCWRVVRILGDGSTKLILEDQYTTCDNTEEYTGNWNIGSARIGSYNYSDGKAILQYLPPINGKMAWLFKNYQTILAKKLDNTIGENPSLEVINNVLSEKLKAGDWCFDDSLYKDDKGETPILNPIEYLQQQEWAVLQYGAYTRINTNKTPTLECKGQVMDDFDDNGDSSTPMYVATLTADEVAFAGATTSSNNNYYIMNDYSRFNYSFFTLSPMTHYGTDGFEYYVDQFGGLSDSSLNISNRPAVIIKNDITATTNSDIENKGLPGTQTNPYVIE